MAETKLEALSLLDIVEHILRLSDEPMSIYDLIEKAATTKALDPSDSKAMTQLYMDITLSGRFVFVGEDKWALKAGNLEYWDKDGFDFVTPSDAESLEDEEEIDFSEFNIDDLEVFDELEEEKKVEKEKDQDEDEEDEEYDEEIEEEKAYVDVGLDLETTDEDDEIDDIDLDLDDDYDEDDYNEIMDDYEDMYGD